MHPLETFKYCPRCGSREFAERTDRSKGCGVCGLEYYANASAAVAAIITDGTGRVLLTTRAYAPAKGSLDLPGGFVDHDETAEEALRREVREELGVELTDARYLESRPNVYNYSGVDVHTLDLIFSATIAPDAVIRPADDAADAQFYELSPVVIGRVGLQSIQTVLKNLYNKGR